MINIYNRLSWRNCIKLYGNVHWSSIAQKSGRNELTIGDLPITIIVSGQFMIFWYLAHRRSHTSNAHAHLYTWGMNFHPSLYMCPCCGCECREVSGDTACKYNNVPKSHECAQYKSELSTLWYTCLVICEYQMCILISTAWSVSLFLVPYMFKINAYSFHIYELI